MLSKKRWAQELIFTEEGIFKISKNENTSKVTWYTVLAANSQSNIKREVC